MYQKKENKKPSYLMQIGALTLAASLCFTACTKKPTQEEMAETARQDSIRAADSIALVATQMAELDSIKGAHTEAEDDAAWFQAKTQNTNEGYEKYLAEFPSGKYREEAKTAMTPVDVAETAMGTNLSFVFVKGGTFTMGSPETEEHRSGEEKQHKVEVGSFSIGKYEVTQAQWKSVMGTEPAYFKSCNDCPIENIGWGEAQAFIRKLNEKTGKKYRLPTEAEWEYAARGGASAGKYAQYAGGADLNSLAWCHDNSKSATSPVGKKKPNQLGIYDMSGNVYEWCSDWYSRTYYGESPAKDPKGPASGKARVLRGGSWIANNDLCRVAYRNYGDPDQPNGNIGFRLCY